MPKTAAYVTGKTVMPGFISAHDHFISSKWSTSGIQLFDLEKKEDVIDL